MLTTDTGVIIPMRIPPEIWAWYNLKGDAAILLLHFVVGIILLALIEMEVQNLFDWCPSFGCRSKKLVKGEDLIKDDDVFAEEQRVALQGKDTSTFINNQ